MENCKVCKSKTDNGFNINFKRTPICESCAQAIFLQQATWYVQTEREKSKEEKEMEIAREVIRKNYPTCEIINEERFERGIRFLFHSRSDDYSAGTDSDTVLFEIIQQIAYEQRSNVK